MNEDNQTPDISNEAMIMPEGATPVVETEQPEPIANGPILILLVALLLIILGGMYYWFSILERNSTLAPIETTRPTAEENDEPESTTAEAQTETMMVVSTSDDISALESDIESTNLDSLDAELQAIDAELEAAIQ